MGIEETLENPLKAAYYTGLFYLLGTILIVFPFFLGLNSTSALLTSATAAIIAWTISGFIVALTSGLSATRKILEMLITGLGAATITYTIGSLISSILGISLL
jgi:VIT1/CCC1 family predicted Fe2+/Mn2+ transporter